MKRTEKKAQNTVASEKSRALVQRLIRISAPKTDPDGSYTGSPQKNGERPVQDADDL